MRKLLKLILTLLLFSSLFQTSPAQAEQWTFLSPSHVFAPLLADPREPNNSLEISPDTTRYDLSLGGTLDLFQLKLSDGNQWAVGILGAGYLKIIRYAWASWRLEDSDLWYGFYLSQSSGPFSNRLEYEHGSSHLGDWLFGPAGAQFSQYDQTFTDQQAFPYLRDLIQYTASYQPFDALRLYGGLGYWLYATPTVQLCYIHLGAELYSNYFTVIGVSVRGIFAYDLKIGDQVAGIADQNFQLGFQLKSTPESLSALNLTLDYYNGNSEYGQFYNQSDNRFGFGIAFLP